MTEYAAGGSLSSALDKRKKSGSLNWKLRLKLVYEASQGLAYMHGFRNQAREEPL